VTPLICLAKHIKGIYANVKYLKRIRKSLECLQKSSEAFGYGRAFLENPCSSKVKHVMPVTQQQLAGTQIAGSDSHFKAVYIVLVSPN